MGQKYKIQDLRWPTSYNYDEMCVGCLRLFMRVFRFRSIGLRPAKDLSAWPAADTEASLPTQVKTL